MRLVLIPFLIVVFAGAAFSYNNDLRQDALAIFKPLPQSPGDFADNPSNPAKVDLGRTLYFDERLSAGKKISCNSCHNLDGWGVDNLSKSIGHEGAEGRRNAPTVYNTIFNVALFWDGRARSLSQQAKMPIENAVEMNNTPEGVMTTLQAIPGYKTMFSEAFPDQTAPLTYDNVARALESFQRTLTTPNSPFDRFLRGEDNAMSEQQLRGLGQFINQGCVTCHRGTNIGGNALFTFGMMVAPEEHVRPVDDHGRKEVSGRALHDYTFRVAPLRNVAKTAPYFHSGVVWDLRDAVRIMAKSQLNARLTDEEVADIVAFLGSLTGERPLIVRPALPPNAKATKISAD